MDAKTSMERLMEGNRRFVEGNPQHPRGGMERRLEILAGQKPLAAVLSCSDSRVPPEIVFDQGLGDLFVIRNAGNIMDEAVLGSLEYAVEHLNIPLIVVLGHEKCGAVTAAAQAGDGHGSHSGYIGQILKKIAPAVESVRRAPGDLIEQAALENARRTAEEIRHAPSLLPERFERGMVEVCSAYYHLESGLVDFLPVEQREPWQIPIAGLMSPE